MPGEASILRTRSTVAAFLCEGGAILQLLGDARFEDRRSDDRGVVDVDEDNADEADAVDDLAKYERAAIERRDVGFLFLFFNRSLTQGHKYALSPPGWTGRF